MLPKVDRIFKQEVASPPSWEIESTNCWKETGIEVVTSLVHWATPLPPPPPSGHDMWYTYTVPILYSVLLGEESRGSNRPQTSPVTLSTLTALLVVFVRRNRTWYCPSLCKHEPFKNTNWLRLEVSVNIKKFDLTYGKKNYVRFGSAFFLHGSGSNLNYKYGSGSGSNLFLDPA